MEGNTKHVNEALTTLTDASVTIKMSRLPTKGRLSLSYGQIWKTEDWYIDVRPLRQSQQSKKDATPIVSEDGDVYHRLTKAFNRLAHPLKTFSRKKWRTSLPSTLRNVRTAFLALTDKVFSTPLLTVPNAGLQYSLDCDTSDYGIGFALVQSHPGRDKKPVCFWSISLIPADEKYSTSEDECLAVIWTFKTLRPCLMYRTFVV